MDEDVKHSIEGLRELFLEKFNSLEKQLELKDGQNSERRANQVLKDSEQDRRLDVLENRVTNLEKAPAEGTQKRWQGIVDKILAWLVPFLLMLLLLWGQRGFTLK